MYALTENANNRTVCVAGFPRVTNYQLAVNRNRSDKYRIIVNDTSVISREPLLPTEPAVHRISSPPCADATNSSTGLRKPDVTIHGRLFWLSVSRVRFAKQLADDVLTILQW